MLEHGGRLQAAAIKQGIALDQWLDLSTGINPQGWPVPAVPDVCWQRLPENEDGLLEAAQSFYGQQQLLLMSGSQAAIQGLPQLRPPCRVAVATPSYAEHAYQWKVRGHAVSEYPFAELDSAVDESDVMVIVNPNNPTGDLVSCEQLLEWHKRLHARGGWLIVDEAFMDSTPEASLLNVSLEQGLIVLRSLGKFFGLAGLRVGAVFGDKALIHYLDEMQGPWPLSTPSRWLARRALKDDDWQQQSARQLQKDGQRLRQLLLRAGFAEVRGCSLFQWVESEHAVAIYDCFAQQGILLRHYLQPLSLRFGLPGSEQEWLRLDAALGSPELRELIKQSGRS